MLVLSRKIQQGVIVDLPGGEELKVVVANIKGGVVRLGIEAPQHVAIRRDELPPRAVAAPIAPAPPLNPMSAPAA